MEHIFKSEFSETERVKKTSHARWHQPSPDAEFHKPQWGKIDKNGPIEAEGEPTASDAGNDDQVQPPIQVPKFSFDEQEMAIMSAKVAALARHSGMEEGFQAAAGHQLRILENIAREVERFAASLTLPVNAIKTELIALIDGMLSALCLPEDDGERRAALCKGIEICLEALRETTPLVVKLAASDMALIDGLLTKFGQDHNMNNIEFQTADDVQPGSIRVTWPGGGMDRLITGRHDALHSILAELAQDNNAATGETTQETGEGAAN